MKRLLAVLASVVASGCQALPDVSYQVVTSSDNLPTNEIASYALQETTLQFTAGKNDTITLTPGRADHQGARIAMFDAASLGIENDIGIVKFENTDIPQEINVKVTDSRKELIEKIGTLAATAIGIAGRAFRADKNISPPLSINLSDSIVSSQGRTAHVVVLADSGVTLNFLEVPVDAIETQKLSNQAAGPYFYYAACRSAEVYYRHNDEDMSTILKVSDPNYLQRVRLPYDGKVTMHSQCGASVSGKLKGADGAEIALIQALVEQANLVKEAIEKSASEGED